MNDELGDYIFFGSGDSVDKDILVIVDELISSIQRCREICSTYLPLDANLATACDGKLTWVFKGTVDEVNNSVLRTYNLHEQFIPSVVNYTLTRDKLLKIKRCVRGLLSTCSRTQHREAVKNSLKSNSLYQQLTVLLSINFKDIVNNSEDKNNSFPKKGTNTEVFKFLAFQLGQTIALLLDRTELYTKQEVSNYFKDLTPFLYRENNVNVDVLNRYKELLIGLI